MFIDTHCHLDFEDFDKDREAVITRYRSAGGGLLVNAACDMESTRRALAHKYEFVYSSAGIHPHGAQDAADRDIENIKELAKDVKVVAIGEVGLDYHRNLSGTRSQKLLLEKFLAIAKEINKPVIFHTRDAWTDIIDMIKTWMTLPAKGLMHCFSGDEEALKECLDMGLYISFACNLTFKNADKLRKIAAIVPMERLLLETDSPYLAPEQLRGRRNEPSYLKFLIDAIAQLKSMQTEDVENITARNAGAFFNIKTTAQDR